MKKLLIFTVLLFVTGCHSYIELNDLAIIHAIGIEKVDNTYKFYACIVKEVDKETMNPETTLYEIEGNSLNEIIDTLSLNLSKKIYLSHLDLLIINDSIKTNEWMEIINFFLNNNETREDFLVAYSEDIKNILENTKFKEINDLVKNNQKETSKTIYTTMYDVIHSYFQKEEIYLTKTNYSNHLYSNGIKIFSNNKYETIEEEKVIFMNYLKNNIYTYKYSYLCENNKFLYLNILMGNTNEIKNEIIITNEIKVITNDCNYKKEDIDKVFTTYLKENLEKLTEKKLTIHNTIRGNYENK